MPKACVRCCYAAVQVNNAAMAPRTWTKEALDTSIATNYTGPVTLTLKSAPFLAPGTTPPLTASPSVLLPLPRCRMP
jgi:hypothetical protein